MVADRLDRSGNPYLVGFAAAATHLHRVLLAPIWDGGLVHVDSSEKRCPVHHCPPELAEHQPAVL